MSWSPQRSPLRPLPVLVAITRPLQQSVSIAFISNNCLPGHTHTPIPSPGLPPFSQQVKSIWKRTLLILLVRPIIILGFLITHLIFCPQLKYLIALVPFLFPVTSSHVTSSE